MSAPENAARQNSKHLSSQHLPVTRPHEANAQSAHSNEREEPAQKSPRKNRRRRRKGRSAPAAQANAGQPEIGPDIRSDTGPGTGLENEPENGTAHSHAPASAQTSDATESASTARLENQTKSSRRRTTRRPRRKDKPVAPVVGTDPRHGVENTSTRANRSARPKREHQPPVRRKPRDGAGSSPSATNAYAALDLGTNNCRLLVAVPQQPGRFRVIDAFSRIVRLGEGLGASGRLADAAMERAVGALAACAQKLKNRPVKGVRLIATEACRRAENGALFLHRVKEETGLDLEIIDRETEARLAVAGCASLVDRKARGVVLFDIGGGSSELALLDLEKRRKHDLGPAMVSWTSMPFGVVTLSEKHGGGRLVTRSVFETMVAEASDYLATFEGRDALEDAAKQGEIHLLGTSGTVTTLAGIHLELPRYDRRRVDGTWMASAQVTRMVDALVDMSFEDRVSNPCIGRDRADLVLAGCAILVAIQRMWPCERLRVADRGLREGLLTEMMNADNAWIRKPNRAIRKR